MQKKSYLIFLVFLLLGCGAIDNHKKTNTILDYVKSGNIKKVQKTVANGIDINFQGVNQITPLSVAVENGCNEIVEWLLANGAEVDAKDRRGTTPLMTAAWNGDSIIIQKLLEYGADPNLMDEYGNTPLFLAADGISIFGKGSVECVRMLLEAGANPDFGGDSEDKALNEASRNGNVEIVRMLIDAGADLEIKGLNHFTPLINASNNNKLEVVEILIDAGANVNARSYFETSAMHHSNNLDILGLLIAHGAEIDPQDISGETPLYNAVKCRGKEKVRFLIDHGANPKIKDKHGLNSIGLAANKNLDLEF